MNENLGKAMAVWRGGADIDDALAVAFSVSQRCAFALASGRVDLLPEPYGTPGRAWLRLDDSQRGAVREWNARGATEAEWLAHEAALEGIANHGSALPSRLEPRRPEGSVPGGPR